MRADCRQLADMENTQFITDATITAWLNKALCSLWDMLIIADPDFAYSGAPTNIVTTPGTPSYVVPANFYKHRGVDRVEGSGASARRSRLEEYMQVDRVGPLNSATQVLSRFSIRGNGTNTRIWFDPDPGAYTYELHYSTAAPTLAADGDTFDGVSGWEEWPIIKVAIKMLIKEKQDTRALERLLAVTEASATKLAAQSRNSECETSIALVRPSLRRGHRRILDW